MKSHINLAYFLIVNDLYFEIINIEIETNDLLRRALKQSNIRIKCDNKINQVFFIFKTIEL